MLHRYYSKMSTRKILVESLRFYADRFNILFFPFLILSLAESTLWKFAFDLIPPFKIQPGFTEIFLVHLIDYLAFVIPIIVIFVLISWVINIIPNGIVIKYSSDFLEGRPSSLRRSLRTVAFNIFPLLLTEFIRGLLVILGLILLVIPGIIMAVIFSLAVQVIIIEGLGTFKSLQRSKKLVAKEPWQTFSIFIFIFFLITVAGIGGEILSSYLWIRTELYVKLIITDMILSIAKPVQPITLTYLYYSLKADQKIMETHKIYPQVFPASPSRERERWELIEFHPRFCFKCGQKLPSDAIYCPRCGVKVKT